MSLDPTSTARLSQVCPALAAKIIALAELLASESMVIRVTQGLRSWAQQDALYQQGRTTPGNIVTNAPAGSSWHEFGLAVDLVVMNPDGTCDWDAADPAWQKMIETGESLGLFSGSQFCSIKDNPHFQLTGSFPVSPNEEARQIFLNAGMTSVWVEAGLYTPQGDHP